MNSILKTQAFLLGLVFQSLFLSSAFAMSWGDLGAVASDEEFLADLNRQATSLTLGSRILGAGLSTPFSHKGGAEVELILGGSAEVAHYRAVFESVALIAELDFLKTHELNESDLVNKLTLLTRKSAFKILLPESLQEALHDRIISGLKDSHSDASILKRWIAGAESVIQLIRARATEAGYPLTKSLLIINVAKELAPTGAVSLADMPLQMLREDDDLTFFLKYPHGNVRTIFAPWVDSLSFDISRDLPILSLSILRAHQNGFTVFVHCKQGISRSVALVLDYLAHHTLLKKDASLASASAISPADTIQEALLSLQTLRSIAHPNPHFMDTLQARITE